MGFFDGNVDNGFDAMFDFNGDGKLDIIEGAAQLDFLDQAERESESYTDEFSVDFEDALSDAGLDIDDLDIMSRDEIEDALDSAGYDIDDFE